MAYGIRITGLDSARRLLGSNFNGALKTATKAIALEVQGIIAPYPPAGLANSPENPTMRWYERGYGPRWWVIGEGAREYLMGRRKRNIKKTGMGGFGLSRGAVLAQARKGRIHGSKTSEMMNRGWSVKSLGKTSYTVGNRASYAKHLHDADEQADWAGRRGWVTDRTAIEQVIRSGTVKRITKQALIAAIKKKGRT